MTLRSIGDLTERLFPKDPFPDQSFETVYNNTRLLYDSISVVGHTEEYSPGAKYAKQHFTLQKHLTSLKIKSKGSRDKKNKYKMQKKEFKELDRNF